MFKFETEYNKKAIRTMATALRKTLRKKKNLKSRVLGLLVVLCAILLTLPQLRGEAPIKANTIVTWIGAAIIIIALLFEDALNGFFAKRIMLAGTANATSFFNEENYINETAVGKTEFNYDAVAAIAEGEDYFVFMLDNRYAQVYDKNNMSGGTVDAFRRFISQKTGKKVVSIMKK